MSHQPLQWCNRTHTLSCALTVSLCAGCGDEILQTATLAEPGPGWSCEAIPQGNEAFLDGAIAGGDAPEGSPFVGDWYAALEGPGLSIAARDTFQVYLNGRLVKESDAARTPSFLPMTIPPGDNVLAIAIAASDGPAAALVHLAELEQDHVSDDTWKVSATPPAGWASVDYDDGAWAAATELAEYGDVPGCDPESDFPSASTARWLGLSESEVAIVLRKRIHIAATGFGASTTGGGATEPIFVSTWQELEQAVDSDQSTVIALSEGSYDFRADPTDQEVCPSACPDEPEKTEYQVLLDDATCENPLTTVQRNDRRLGVNSNKTIVGLGRGAAIRGMTLDLGGTGNVIVRNVALYDINPHILEAGDAFSLTAAERVWFDHGTVRWASDGFTDLRDESQEVTLSYMHYDGQDDVLCGGVHSWTSVVADSSLTVHHSRYHHAASRAPMVRGVSSRAHLFNNVFSNITHWAVGSTCAAQVLLEANTFENVDAASFRADCEGDGVLGLIFAPPSSNLYRGDSNVHRGADGTEPRDDVFAVPYEYPLDPASAAWPLVVSRAGTGGPWALPLVLD